MTQYIYPQNLKATANLWLWSLRDFVILAVAALLSVLALVQLHIFLPAVAVLCYGFLTIRMRLLARLSQIIRDDAEKRNTNSRTIDRKLMRKIEEKKMAQGQKMGC